MRVECSVASVTDSVQVVVLWAVRVVFVGIGGVRSSSAGVEALTCLVLLDC